jgi:tetratricopeptide (TPR) repeat protein
LPQVVLNKGLACRQLLLPGAKTAENQRLVDCALRAFDRLKQLDPGDARAEQLYVQTLFDADRFETLVEMYQRRLKASPNDLGAINGLIQVSSRAGRWEETLSWTLRRAEVAPRDAEAQYAVGVLIWNRLFQEGGSGPRASFDPRPEANQIPLPFDANDVVGAERVRLADQGITYLERALSIRPNYREAMSYLNLLHRQKSFAFFERPEAWQASMDQAEIWRKKALAAEATHRVRGR